MEHKSSTSKNKDEHPAKEVEHIQPQISSADLTYKTIQLQRSTADSPVEMIQPQISINSFLIQPILATIGREETADSEQNELQLKLCQDGAKEHGEPLTDRYLNKRHLASIQHTYTTPTGQNECTQHAQCHLSFTNQTVCIGQRNINVPNVKRNMSMHLL